MALSQISTAPELFPSPQTMQILITCLEVTKRSLLRKFFVDYMVNMEGSKWNFFFSNLDKNPRDVLKLAED